MLYRIHEILLVASPYDAFILEEDGRLTQQILYEYLGMNLSYAPRVWHADNATIGLKMLSDRSYDLVIVMMRIADMDPITFGEKVKADFPDKPIILLAFDESEITALPQARLNQSIDKVFIWSGNANVFPAIIKNIEDRENLRRDFEIADIRAIIMVEDDPRYYSIILPRIYRTALKHARSLINKSLSDTDKLLVFRARPKVILVSTYEEAIALYDNYRHNILGLISDVRFPKDGELDYHAGVTLASYVREKDSDMPIVLQSTNSRHVKDAKKANASFIHKKSPTLLQDLENFIVNNFGFGDFIFRDKRQKEIARAGDMNALRYHLSKIPEKSLEYHASKNHFSNWLAVRGEFSTASNIRPLKLHDFSNLNDLRKLLIEQIDISIQAQNEGRIVQYSSASKDESLNFVRLASGSLGGKDKSILKAFLKGKLSKKLIQTLSKYLSEVKYPIAVRSSSLLEDSQYQPLAGMYATYMLPNSDKSKTARLDHLMKAIKLVFASTYLKEPRSLIENSVHRHEEEKMAVIIMELIGKKHEDRFYPSVSGSAQSFNYYPISYMKREEGVAYLALGLGRTIAEGEKSLRFSPKYPGIIPQYYSVRSTIDNSQNQFYGLNLQKGVKLLKYGEEENTSIYDLDVAEQDGELHWAGSVVSETDNVIRDSLRHPGNRVITFPSLLKWKSAPVPDLLMDVLAMGENALGCPVEIEFAINLHKGSDTPHEFALLQIKPMVIGGLDRIQEFEFIHDDDILCKSQVALGNGVIDNIQNIIMVDPETFDASQTQTIAKDIEHINHKMPKGEQYILVGPGRWGTADPWLGVPVEWDQISHAKVIIEYGMI